jgi:hypothetical protein
VTVLIAFPEYLPLLQTDDLSEALVFPATEIRAAIDAIVERRPGVIAVQDLFAVSRRGIALINRIKADPALRDCRIRLVTYRDEGGPSGAPLDFKGTRRAPRFTIAEDVEVQIDGKQAVLVNLSLVGAQVLSTHALKPNQRIRFAFVADDGRSVRIRSGVVTVSMEIVRATRYYRAGIEFVDPDHAEVQRLIDSKKK